LPDTPDPVGHRLHRLSIFPTIPPPSLCHVPHRSPRAYPVSLPGPADSALNDSLAGSNLRSPAWPLHTSRPPLPAFSELPLRTIHGCTAHLDTPHPYNSIHREAAFAPLWRATADDLPSESHPPPQPLPPAQSGNIPDTAPPSLAQTATWHTPLRPRSSRHLLSAPTKDRTSTLHGAPFPLPRSPIPGVPASIAACSAMQTSFETMDCAPGFSPDLQSPPPAQMECPDALALQSSGSSPARATRLLLAIPKHRPATPTY